MSGDASGEGHVATSMARRCPRCASQYPYEQEHHCPAELAETAAQSGSQAGPLTKPTLPEPGLRREADDLIGVILGDRYEIQERISRGGMGVVYKARHVVLESQLAVKFLLRPQDEDARHRFLLEAKLASKISHPNTVAISDFGVLSDGRSYLVMEFLRGPTLAKVLKDAQHLDAKRACHIALQIARGLHAVHDQGIVHRGPFEDQKASRDRDPKWGVKTLGKRRKNGDLTLVLDGSEQGRAFSGAHRAQ